MKLNKGWTVSNCYMLYELAKRTVRRSGYKYSMTKDEEYLKIRRESSKILTLLEEKDLNEVNLDEIYDRISELYIQIRKLNEVVDASKNINKISKVNSLE